jgi:zinc protease
VANTVLGVFGMYGRLGKSVRSTNGLAYYAYSKVDGGKGPGPWRVVAGVNPANVDRALELVLTELRTLREAPVPEEELNDSRSYLTGSLPLRLETNEGVAQALINIERYDLGMDYLQQYAEMIAGVTPDQVQAVAQRWIDPEHYALAIAEPAPEVTT